MSHPTHSTRDAALHTIFLVLERFNNYSDILRGKLIGALADSFRVVVVTPDLDQDAQEKSGYFTHPNIIYEKIGAYYPKLWRLTEHYLRKYFVRSFDYLRTTNFLYYQYPYRLRDRILRDIGALLPKKIMTPALFTAMESLIVRSSPQFSQLVERYHPTLVVTGTPGFGYMPLMTEAVLFSKKLKIPTIAINASIDNPYTMPKFVRKTDYLSVWHPWMQEKSIELFGYPRERIFLGGCLKFDHYFNDVKEGKIQSRESFIRAKGLDPTKKLIVYATPTPGTYKPRKELMKELVRMKQAGGFVDDPNLLVRLHPFDAWEPYEEFIKIPGITIERSGAYRGRDGITAGPTVEMDEQDRINQTETFRYADVLINHPSTTLLEAAIFDTPVVTVAWPDKSAAAFNTEMSQTLDPLGAMRVARNPEALTHHVNAYLKQPELDTEARKKMVEQFVHFTDGLSWQRILHYMQELLAKNSKI
ncbi:MAG: hypothetical protein G01um101466_193 [Parcubacteria group bacterium Gr01-1014_66]|nr:MAG: hypothetical protein G01um101466_193 [Parcubacteria group bacterium Gr01-1014_66]